MVTWNNGPTWLNTDQPHLLGGSYTSYTNDHCTINYNHTFKGLTNGLPVCFNFPTGCSQDLITPSKEGCVGASKKLLLTDSPLTAPEDKKRSRLVWKLLARMPGVLDPYESKFQLALTGYPNCNEIAFSDVIWKTIDNLLGYPSWKSCTYNSKMDYIIPGGKSFSVQDWSNPNSRQKPTLVHGYTAKFHNWNNQLIHWPLAANRWHHNQFVPPMLSYTIKNKTFWQPEIWRALAATSPITLSRPKNDSIYSALACLSSPYVFLFTNNSKNLQIHMNYTARPNKVSCKQCMLSSCLNPQYNVCSFVVLQHP